MSEVWSLSGGKRTSGGQPNSVAFDTRAIGAHWPRPFQLLSLVGWKHGPDHPINSGIAGVVMLLTSLVLWFGSWQ
jgi:hypothetical protein